MKKNYYTGCYAGCIAIFLFFAIPNKVTAQFNTDVGLRSGVVQMPAIGQLKSAYLAPAYAALESVAHSFSPTFVSTNANEGEQMIGGGLAYGSEIERLGLQLSYLYFMTAAIALGGNLTFFLPEKTEFLDTSITQSFITLNVMAHYIIYTAVIFRTYALAGLNYSLFRDKIKSGVGTETFSSSEIGLNLGIGIEYALATGFLFLELKYILSKFDQGVIAFGYRFLLGR